MLVLDELLVDVRVDRARSRYSMLVQKFAPRLQYLLVFLVDSRVDVKFSKLGDNSSVEARLDTENFGDIFSR
jgi:hypothetical protein